MGLPYHGRFRTRATASGRCRTPAAFRRSGPEGLYLKRLRFGFTSCRQSGVIPFAHAFSPYYSRHHLALTPGTRLGVYEVTAQIGEGGMGQVYRAHDTKLNRDVALKIAADRAGSDPPRRGAALPT